MSKSKYPAWVNPTRDSLWDGYYETFWAICGPVVLLFLVIFAGRV